MSRKENLEIIMTQMNSMSIEQAAMLEYIGKMGKEVAWDRDGQYLDSEARSANKSKPMSTANTMDELSITIGNKVITVVQDKDTAPAVSTPFGLSDRVTQASLPKDWMIQALYQFIIDSNGGDTAFATSVNTFINDCLDFATIHNDDGSIKKIDATKLPTPVMAVFTEDLISSHKRQTISKSKGSTAFNIKLVIDQDDSIPSRIPMRTTGFVGVPGMPTPIAPTLSDAHSDAQVVTHHIDPQVANAIEESMGFSQESVGLSVSPPSLVDIIGLEPMTKGDIRKAIEGSVHEAIWVSDLNELVDSGVVTKTTNGGPRSTRYTYNGVSA